MTRQDHLRGYLAAVIADLAKRKIIRMGDPVEEIVKRVGAEFTRDVAGDIKGVLRELALTLGENGIRMAFAAGEQYLRGALDSLASGNRQDRKAREDMGKQFMGLAGKIGR